MRLASSLVLTMLALAVASAQSAQGPGFTQTPITPRVSRSTARVHVTVGQSREPVAGAEVRWAPVPGYDDPAGKLGPVREDERERRLAGIPTLATTDEHGDVDVVLEGEQMLVEARAGALWGATEINSDLLRFARGIEPLPLQVEVDLAVPVRVVDAQGLPKTGVPVALRTSEGELVGDARPLLTDEAGIADFKHAGFDMRARAAGRGLQFVVFAMGSFAPRVSASLIPVRSPGQTIELRLPACGEVELVYQDTDGRAIPVHGGVALVSDSVYGTEPPSPFAWWFLSTVFAGGEVRVDPGTERTLYANVSLGSRWTVWVQRNALSNPGHLEFDGPTKEGERVSIVVRPPDVAHVRGKLVDTEGRPRSGAEISIRLFSMPPEGGWHYANFGGVEPFDTQVGTPEFYSHPDTLKADAEGRFCVDLDCASLDGVSHSLAFIEDQGTPSERCAIAKLSAQQGDVELGKLTLAPAPVVAAGVVTDPAGLPLAGVRLEVLETGAGLLGMRFKTTSAADGSFRLIGPCLDKRIEIDVAGEGLLRRSVSDVDVGTRDLRIVVEHAGGIRGHVVFPSGVSARNVTVRWLPYFEVNRGTPSSNSKNPASDGSFEFTEVGAGTYLVYAEWDGSKSNQGLFRKNVRVDVGMISDVGGLALTKQEK